MKDQRVTCKEVILHGLMSYRSGKMIDYNPHIPNDHHCRVMGYCGVKKIGMVRVEVCYYRVWESGYRLGAYLDGKNID